MKTLVFGSLALLGLSASSADAQLLGRLRANAGAGQNVGLGYQIAPNSGGQVLFRPLQNLRERTSGGYDPNTGQPLLQLGRGRPIVDMIGGIAVRAEDSTRLQQILNRGERPVFGQGRLLGSEAQASDGGPLQRLAARLRERLGDRQGEGLMGRIREAIANGDGTRLAGLLQVAGSVLTGVSNGLAAGGGYGGGQDLSGALRRAQEAYNVRKQ